MTQPPSSATPWPMAHGRGRVANPSRRLLKGTCSLVFEGRSFIPDDDRGKEYWLKLSEEMRGHLIELLSSLGWQHEVERFEAEFFGTLRWTGHGFGHLGVFGGIACVQELVAVHFTPTPPRNPGQPPLGIRGLVRRDWRPVRVHHDE